MWKFAITTITLDKNFVKANDEKKRKEITNSLTFFRQINGFTKEVTKELISRKFLSVIAFYSTFPHCLCIAMLILASDFTNFFNPKRSFFLSEKNKNAKRFAFQKTLKLMPNQSSKRYVFKIALKSKKRFRSSRMTSIAWTFVQDVTSPSSNKLNNARQRLKGHASWSPKSCQRSS